MAGEWKSASLREAGVSLIDCDHQTPPSANSGYPRMEKAGHYSTRQRENMILNESIVEDAELSRAATIRKFRIVRQEGARQVNRELIREATISKMEIIGTEGGHAVKWTTCKPHLHVPAERKAA